MEDQYGGRTDDDLFFDDFEPIEDPQPVETVAAPAPPPPPAAVATPPAEPPKPEPVAQKTAEKQSPPPAPASKPPPKAPRGLANSRFNPDKTAAPAPRPPRQATPATASDTPAAVAPPAATTNTSNAPPQAPTGPRAQTPSAPKSSSPAPTHAPHREKQGTQGSSGAAAVPGANTALNAEARMKSGANPRTKLTEEELALKMEQMRILNAEKTRKFERATQDERTHAEAYARGMEEARKRKKADEERRRRGEEDRRRMDDERAKNRERKLKAMSIKEGGWDEGKDALAAEEERRVFRGANGGIRGARSAGLSGSRFANDGDAEGERFEDRRGGRGRGRGRGGRGGRGGGRGGYGGDFERDAAAPPPNGAREAKRAAPEPKAPAITTEEFPALPGGKTGETSPPILSPPVLSPLGRWDEEVESYEASKKSAASGAQP